MPSRHDNTRRKKDLFLANFAAQGFIVKNTMELIGVGRQTFYVWLKEDPDFAQAVENLSHDHIDHVENALMKKINEGDTASIIFFLKTKGKKLGFGDNMDITSGGDKISEIKLIQIDPKKEE